MRLLLISNSTMHGRGYLDHCADEIRELLGETRRVLFVPWALDDLDGYAAKACARFRDLGYECESLHRAPHPGEAVAGAEAMFVGGGNTFRLLTRLWHYDVVRAIRLRAAEGMPYIGSSAGTNVACISIKVTNDMPIVYPPTFDALGLVPFNINPHFIDADPGSTHMGETREKRIQEFHEMNDVPVVGLREGAWLRREGPSLRLGGSTGARLFMPGEPPRELTSGESLDSLLGRPVS